MNLKKGELKVFYVGSDWAENNQEIDKAIEKALEPFGFKRWASGYGTQDNIRDLAFHRDQTVERADK